MKYTKKFGKVNIKYFGAKIGYLLNDNDYELKKGNIHGELIVRYNRDKHRLDINLMPQSIE